MPYNDKDLGSILPVRTGEAQGAANERKMLDKIQDTMGFHTGFRVNPDGGYTMVRTRGGNPEFSTTSPKPNALTKLRGFVKKLTSAVIDLFSPTTLATRQEKYPIHSGNYSVVPVRTSANYKANDGWQWNDVIFIQGSTFYVNGAGVSGVTTGSVPPDAAYIPLLVCDTTADSPYTTGTVFAAGRKAVHKTTPTTALANIYPLTPQAMGDPLYAGQRVTQGVDGAETVMAQLWWTGNFGWDDDFASWAGSATKVVMAITDPFLTAASTTYAVDAPGCMLQYLGAASSSSTTLSSAPSAPYGYLGTYVVVATNGGDWNGQAYSGPIYLQPAIYGTYSVPAQKETASNQSIQPYVGTSSTTIDIGGGKTVLVVAETSMSIVSHAENVGIKTDYLPTGATATGIGGMYYASSSGDPDAPTLIPCGYDRQARVGSTGIGTGGMSGQTYSSGTYSEQATTCAVQLQGIDLCRVELGWFKRPSGGTEIIVSGIERSLPVDPFGYTYDGWGTAGATIAHKDFPSERPDWYKNHLAICSPEVEKTAGEMAGVEFCYPGAYGLGGFGGPHHTGTSQSLPVAFNSYLNWTTRDYLLYDEAEQVYVYVTSTFSGTQSYGDTPTACTADFTVTLHFQTRFGNASRPLYSTTFDFPELFLIEEFESGKWAAQTPKQRVMFFPLYQHQGSFRGAAYTTIAEETGGALPECAMNFRLSLVNYNNMGGLLYDSNNTAAMVPCNLLEMLHAYVYSSSGGMHDDYRYPVFFPTYKTRLDNSLFANTWHVGFRNGLLDIWTTETTEVFRT